jgi:hypothetical protein
MNLLGAPASRRPVGSRKPELAGETPALPGTVPRFKGSKRESVRGNLSSPKGGGGRGDYSSSNPLAPALPPLGQGEGVGGGAKLRPGQ